MDPAGAFAAWYGPAGATIPHATMDVRVGGTRRVCMEVPTPEGAVRMWFAGEYVEVVENGRLVYTEADVRRARQRAPPSEVGMPEGDPTTTEVHVELEAVGGRTRMDDDPRRHPR